MSFGSGHNSFGDARERRKRLTDIHSVMESLRSDLVEAPDLSASILAKVGEERPFTNRGTRRLMAASRLGLLACAGVFAAAGCLVYRYAPGVTGWASVSQPQPFTTVVDMAQESASEGMQTFRSTVQAMSSPAIAVQYRVGFPEIAGKPGVPATTGWTGTARVVPINRFGKATMFCTARVCTTEGNAGTVRTDVAQVPTVASPTSRPAPPAANPMAAMLRPILPERAYGRVMTLASRAQGAAIPAGSAGVQPHGDLFPELPTVVPVAGRPFEAGLPR